MNKIVENALSRNVKKFLF